MDTDQSKNSGGDLADAPNLAMALARAQAVMRNAATSREADITKTAKRRYSTLADVWDACREPLTSNGLCVSQIPCTKQVDGQLSVEVTTVLMHGPSDETIRGVLVMPVQQRHPQAIGTAITYARRYALSAIVGIAPDDDDDGAEASTPPTPPPQQPPRSTERRTISTERPQPVNGGAPKGVTKETYEVLAKWNQISKASSKTIRAAARVPISGPLTEEEDAVLRVYCETQIATKEGRGEVSG